VLAGAFGLPSLSTAKGGVNNRSCPGFPARSGEGVWFALTLYRKVATLNSRSRPGFPARSGGGVWLALTLYRKGTTLPL